ncbi:hypothetical protein AMATHDRAFT_9190 [Amanita thiersii Skay4041]|uniref:Retrotransposon Copia-like N-terminal domain-containing protein n=1 Tax=Amanita thiersii Skay4041 TaxID=703135 RepID=A0A2A9NCW6_9AGAR|nr:hypothetical protein AMATHDRAFT_9190 [Amanita thiersii Skay4041]
MHYSSWRVNQDIVRTTPHNIFIPVQTKGGEKLNHTSDSPVWKHHGLCYLVAIKEEYLGLCAWPKWPTVKYLMQINHKYHKDIKFRVTLDQGFDPVGWSVIESLAKTHCASTLVGGEGSGNMINHIPLLDGSNYHQWSSLTEAYLQVQNLQDVITTDGPGPKEEGYDTWKKMNIQVLGLLKMMVIIKLHYLIGDNAKTSWNNIKTQFDTPGIWAIFNNFRTCAQYRMNPNNLMKDLGKLNTMFNCLAAYGEPVSNAFQAIMVIAAFPAGWDNLASTILATHSKETLMVEKITPIIKNTSVINL